MSQDETTKEYEALTLREKEDVDALKLEISHLQGLVSFGKSDAGKVLIDERERQVIKYINRLFKYLDKEPNLGEIISSIAQLKIAMRDLVDFKGSQSSIEDRQIAIDTIMKRR